MELVHEEMQRIIQHCGTQVRHFAKLKTQKSEVVGPGLTRNLFGGKLSQYSRKPVQFILDSIPCVFCGRVCYLKLLVIIFGCSVHVVIGFQKNSFDRGGGGRVGGRTSFFLDLQNPLVHKLTTTAVHQYSVFCRSTN